MCFSITTESSVRGEQILTKNERMFNCATCYMDKVETIHKAFFSYVVRMWCRSKYVEKVDIKATQYQTKRKWTSKLPNIKQRDKNNIKNFVIPDTIEGWLMQREF